MPRINRPISKQDLEFYEARLVLVVARTMADVSEQEWETMSPNRRGRWLRKALSVVFEILADQNFVERLPLQLRNLNSRL